MKINLPTLPCKFPAFKVGCCARLFLTDKLTEYIRLQDLIPLGYSPPNYLQTKIFYIVFRQLKQAGNVFGLILPNLL